MTCAPSRRRSASCSRWVAEWCARRLVRRLPSTFISTASPTFTLPLVTLPRWTNRSPTLRCVSVTAMVAPLAGDQLRRCRPSGRRTRRRTASGWRSARSRRLPWRDFTSAPFFEQRDDLAFRLLGRVAEELGGAEALAQVEPHRFGRRLARAGPGRARALALLLELGVEAVDIDLDAAVAQDRLREVEREAAAVVQLERDRAGAACRPWSGRRRRRPRFPVPCRPALERLLEAGLLQLQRLGDQRLRRGSAPHRPGPSAATSAGTSFHISGSVQPMMVRMAHGAAHDPAQHIAAAFVRRQHAIGDQERGRSADGRR